MCTYVLFVIVVIWIGHAMRRLLGFVLVSRKMSLKLECLCFNGCLHVYLMEVRLLENTSQKLNDIMYTHKEAKQEKTQLL